MSGIAARYSCDSRAADATAVWAMLRAVPHRGSHSAAVAEYGQVVLGSTAHANACAEGNEQQPKCSARTGCAIVADVRLDNRAELLRSLSGVPPSIGDAELLLRLYEARSLAMLPALLGDFAFVLWDPRSRQLICARDTSGQRDLYYHLSRSAFTAATEIQQLFVDPALPIAVNEQRLDRYLAPINLGQNAKQTSETFFQGVYALAAGHVLILDDDGLRKRQYWRLQPPTPIVYRNTADYAEQFRELFFEAVRARLRTPAPIGVMLSGGLDSSSIACSAMRLVQSGEVSLSQPIYGYTVAFDQDVQSERGYVAEISAQYGLPVRYVMPDSYAGRLQVESTTWLDAPDDALPVFYRTLYDRMASDGVRTLLTGEMADAYVGGSPFVLDRLLRRARVRDFVRTYRTIRTISPLSRGDILLRGCVFPLLPGPLQAWATRVNGARFRRAVRGHILPDWISEQRRAAIEQYHWELSEELDRESGCAFEHAVQQQAYRALYPPEVGYHAQGCAWQFVRPYADRRLHQFMLAIPPETHFQTSKTVASLYEGQKQIVRRAMAGILPEQQRVRKEKTFFTNIWQREVDAQWERCQELFGPDGGSEAAERGYIDRERFWQRLHAARAGEIGSDHRYLMAMLSIEGWLTSVRAAATRLPPRVANRPAEEAVAL